MKRKRYISVLAVMSVMTALGGCGMQNNFVEEQPQNMTIGISVYDQYDTFISELMSQFQSYVKEKEKDWGISITLEIQNAEQNQLVQNIQLDSFIEDGVDIDSINLVDRTDASSIIEKAKTSDVPVIFFNRELVKEDLERWDKLYYVGSDAYESG